MLRNLAKCADNYCNLCSVCEDTWAMAADVNRMLTQTLPRSELYGRQVIFTLAEAQRALCYVSSVVADASSAFRTIQQCRSILLQRRQMHERLLTEQELSHAMHRLNRAIDECNAVGVDLVDIESGTVRFNARIQGKPAGLHWQLGEPIEDAWQSNAAPRESSRQVTPPAAVSRD